MHRDKKGQTIDLYKGYVIYMWTSELTASV